MGTTSMDPSKESSTGTSSGASTPIEPPKGCVCKAPTLEGPNGSAPTCAEALDIECEDAKPLCDTLETECARSDQFYGCETDIIYDAEAVECALDALRDRTRGEITIRIVDPHNCGFEGCGSRWYTYRILGDEALSTFCKGGVMWLDDAGSSMRSLASPEYFEACKELDHTVDQVECLREGLPVASGVCD